MSGIPFICFTGRIIQDAVVCGPSRRFAGGLYAPFWRMRCILCGTEFAARSADLNKRQHQHTCDPATKAAYQSSTDPEHHQRTASRLQTAIKWRIARARNRTPQDIGLAEAKAYARSQLLYNTPDARELLDALDTEDQRTINEIRNKAGRD